MALLFSLIAAAESMASEMAFEKPVPTFAKDADALALRFSSPVLSALPESTFMPIQPRAVLNGSSAELSASCISFLR
jgi:hypothetical protein